MRLNPDRLGVIHLVGIGGIGMSGIAEILAMQGYQVQGSDRSESANVQRLRDKNIRVLIGHEASHVKTQDGLDVAVVVRSSAVKDDNPEIAQARALGIPVIRRAEMLGELMTLKQGIAISGTHGKTTTTSLVGTVLEEGGIDPTVINGGIVHAYGTNTRLGAGDWMVVEADESDGSFSFLPATAAVVTNIDPEHLDHYGDYDAIKRAFLAFVQKIPFYGFAVLCTDHPAVQGLMTDLQDRRVITYGVNHQADLRCEWVRAEGQTQYFDIVPSETLRRRLNLPETIHDVALPMLGDHNMLNTTAAIACGLQLGVGIAAIKSALATFSGVSRRFTQTGIVDGVTIIDDYGHHPVEIAAVLKAARSGLKDKGRLIAVVQPHRYTRLESLFEDFCTCFNDADHVLVSPVYAAGETPIDGVDHHALAQGLGAHGVRVAEAVDDPESLPRILSDLADEGDMVVFLGAGDITKWAHALPDQMRALASDRGAA